MPRVETKIWLALLARAKAALADLDLPAAWPNKTLGNPPSTGYVRVRHVPNTPNRPFHASDAPHDRSGILQLMLMAPQNEDTAIALDQAGRLAAHFPVDEALRYEDVTVRVTTAPAVGQIVPSGAYAEVAVNVQYRCFA